MRHFRLESILLYLHRISVFTQNLGQTLENSYLIRPALTLSYLKTVTIEVVPYKVGDNFYFILLHSLGNPNREYMGG